MVNKNIYTLGKKFECCGKTIDRAQELGEEFCKAHFHDFRFEIFHSRVGAAVLTPGVCIRWSVHVGKHGNFLYPQRIDYYMHMDIPAMVMPVRVLVRRTSKPDLE